MLEGYACDEAVLQLILERFDKPIYCILTTKLLHSRHI